MNIEMMKEAVAKAHEFFEETRGKNWKDQTTHGEVNAFASCYIKYVKPSGINRPVMRGLPTENEISAMARSTINREDSYVGMIIHVAAFESGARWAISQLSSSPTVASEEKGVREGFYCLDDTCTTQCNHCKTASSDEE